MARKMPDDLKRYDVEEPSRTGDGVVRTTYKLTEADARRRGLLPPEEKPAAQKKRSQPTGRGRKPAAEGEPGAKSSGDED